MKHLFVNYETAKKLKEKGFDENCLAYYGFENNLLPIDTDFHSFREVKDGILCPLYQQIIDWFREKHNININLFHHATSQTYGYRITGKWDEKTSGIIVDNYFIKLSYYSALDAAIEEALKLI